MMPSAGRVDIKLAARLAIGLTQGLGLLALHRWEGLAGDVGPAYYACVYGVAFVAPVLLAAWGAMGRRALAIWAGLVLALLLGLGYYASWRTGGDSAFEFPDAPSWIFAGLFVFIAHHLVQVGTQTGRLRAPYPEYFDLTWKHGVQLALSGLFTCVFWLVLQLGAGLFSLIGISALQRLITQDWFFFPATCLAFAAAVHLTDARASLVIGARSLALTLLAWLVPRLAAIAGAFLLALPLTGLASLWGTKFAAGLLMWAATVLIFLLNAAYQAGEKPTNPVIAAMTRFGCFLLVPLCALAAYGLVLRIGQHGLTTSRVIACAGLFLLSVYAIGYAIAAFGRGAWLARLGMANVACALVSAGVLLALLSPLADPSRLAVDSQMARLMRGAVLPEAFDYAFLDHQSGRWGEAALQKLESGTGDARSLEFAAAVKAYRAGQLAPSGFASVAARRELVPDTTGEGAPLIPAGAFLKLQGGEDPIDGCASQPRNCSFLQTDLTGDEKGEILLFDGSSILVLEPGAKSDAPWGVAARACCVSPQDWNKGEYTIVPQRFSNLRIGDQSLTFIASSPPAQ